MTVPEHPINWHKLPSKIKITRRICICSRCNVLVWQWHILTSFKPLPFNSSQTFSICIFSSVYKSPQCSLHQKEHWSHTYAVLQQILQATEHPTEAFWQTDRQTEDLCTSDWCEWWRGRRKTDRGEWDNNQMNDRLQVFGFARQRLHWLLCLLVWSTQAATFGHDRKKNEKKAAEDVWQRVGEQGLLRRIVPPTVANIWLNFWMGPSLVTLLL